MALSIEELRQKYKQPAQKKQWSSEDRASFLTELNVKQDPSRPLENYKTPEKKDGFWKGFAKDILKPIGEVGVAATNIGESVYDLARGDIAGADEARKKTRNVPFWERQNQPSQGMRILLRVQKRWLDTELKLDHFL